MNPKALLFLVGSVGLAACADNPAYVPATSSSAVVAGRPAAEYAIPPEAPTGGLRLATLGFSDVRPLDAPNKTVKALHIRMLVTNTGKETWTIDPNEQRLVFIGAVESHAGVTFAGTTSQPHVVTIAAGTRRRVDLLFAMPEIYQNVSTAPELDVVWKVRTPNRVIEARTPFDRVGTDATTGDNWEVYGNFGGQGGPNETPSP